MSDLAARFKELRLSKGLTSTALAKPRYSVSYVSQIERGERKPSVDAARYFARRLGVSPEYLWTGVPDDLPQQLRYEAEQAEADIAQDRPADAEHKARHVIEEAERYELVQVQGRALCSLAEALNRQARYAESIETFEKGPDPGPRSHRPGSRHGGPGPSQPGRGRPWLRRTSRRGVPRGGRRTGAYF